MKTMINNLQKGIITAILVSIISSVGYAATKTRETTNATNKNNSEAVIAKTLANSSTGGTSAEPAVNANERDLSDQIEDWMSNGSYWEDENSSEAAEMELSSKIESWMSNGSYWNESHQHKAVEPLSGKIKTWMKSGSYWGSDEK